MKMLCEISDEEEEEEEYLIQDYNRLRTLMKRSSLWYLLGGYLLSSSWCPPAVGKEHSKGITARKRECEAVEALSNLC